MGNKLNKRTPVIILIAFISCIFIAYLFKNKVEVQVDTNNDNKFTYNDDGTVTLGLGMVANGFFDIKTNKIINPGSLLKPVNGKIQGQVSFKQNISDIRNYLLIVMIDYEQHDFTVNDTTYSSYPFSLEGEDDIRINVEIANLNAESHEFTYFIISEPDITELSIDDSNEWNKLLMTSSIYYWRILLSDTTKISIPPYDESYVEIESQKDYGIQLTKTHTAVTAMPSCTSMEDVELIFSNSSDYDNEYMLIAFLDWNQTPINGNDLTKFIKIPSQSTIYYKIKLPFVNEYTPYQIMAIPKPFANDLKIAPPPSSMLRTIIKPK